MRLTPSQRDTLTQAVRQELRRVHDGRPGRPPWPAPAQTLHALVRRGLLDVSEVRNRKGYRVDVWRVTNDGRQALEPKTRTRADRPRYLQRDVWRGGDYTTDPSKSIDVDAGPGRRPVAVAVSEEDLDRFSRARRYAHSVRVEEDQRARIDRERADLDRLLGWARARAEQQGKDIRSDIRVIERRLEAIDRKLAA